MNNLERKHEFYLSMSLENATENDLPFQGGSQFVERDSAAEMSPEELEAKLEEVRASIEKADLMTVPYLMRVCEQCELKEPCCQTDCEIFELAVKYRDRIDEHFEVCKKCSLQDIKCTGFDTERAPLIDFSERERESLEIPTHIAKLLDKFGIDELDNELYNLIKHRERFYGDHIDYRIIEYLADYFLNKAELPEDKLKTYKKEGEYLIVGTYHEKEHVIYVTENHIRFNLPDVGAEVIAYAVNEAKKLLGRVPERILV